MKKYFALLFVIGFTYDQGAAGQSAPKVPGAVKSAFAQRHPGIMAKWEKENGEFEASFKEKGKMMSELYTANAVMTESETDIKISELPPAITRYLHDHYKGMVKEAAIITKASGEVNYEAAINKMDILFDANGKFLKEVKD